VSLRGALGGFFRHQQVAFVLDAVLLSYAQILFSRSHVVGLVLVAATAIQPRLAAFGLAAVVVSTVVARLLQLSEEVIREGIFGYNALLIALGCGAFFEPTGAAIGLAFVAVVAAVFITAAFHSALGLTFNLPALTLPFLFVFFLVIGAAPLLGVPLRSFPADPFVGMVELATPVQLFLQSLGAIFFVPSVASGAVILLALLFHSRIGTVLAVLGFAIAYTLWTETFLMNQGLQPLMVGYNCILVAIALGGVWFVPSLSSFVLALAGTLVCGIVTVGCLPLLTRVGLPLLILPFNVTTILLLYAMRQRIRDGRPKAVDFLLGTPEENLNHYLTRVARFGSRYSVRFQAPVRGCWVCTQGVNGEYTHKGAWRYALDFEVLGSDGMKFRGEGSELRDYHCYGRPVLATANGTVVKVVDGVHDNLIGDVNLRESWGNVVVLYHAPGLYSVVGHLVPGSVKVHEGHTVKQGETLGLCGNSGRSPVPHVHFQLQGTARVGAPTLDIELHDVISCKDGVLHGTYVPSRGEEIRNPECEADVRAMLQLRYGETVTFLETSPDGGAQIERIVADIDLYGNLLVRSRDRRATLYYDLRDNLFTIFDTLGSRRSILHAFQAALARLPLEVDPELTWTDHLPRRHFLPAWSRMLLDPISPFLSRAGIEMRYRAERDGDGVVITGASSRVCRNGEPIVRTRARLDRVHGIEAVSVAVRGRERSIRRI
jgi:urea transporter/murein DD-endopeptidase MepM/ murein hydrolase activator NlpD